MKPKQKPKNGNGKKWLDRAELIIIILFALFGIVWIEYISPMLQYSKFYLSLNPVGAYIVYNSGIIAIFTALFGIPVGFFIKGEINIPDILRGGFASFLGASFFYDMLQPPWAWNPNGTVAIQPTAANMETTSVDYMVGWAFQQIGIHGSMMYILVYIIVPIASVIIMALLLKPKELLKYVMGRG